MGLLEGYAFIGIRAACCCACFSMLMAVIVGIVSAIKLKSSGMEQTWMLQNVHLAEAYQNQKIDQLAPSWEKEPYVDIVVQDTSKLMQGCPATHPEEVIYNVWPGTEQMCDCTHRSRGAVLEMSSWCAKGPKQS